MLQIFAVVCWFIVPRLIISIYGSDVNGMSASITKFLSYIIILEAGVGCVVRVALSKPFAENKDVKISTSLPGIESPFENLLLQ